MSATSSPGASPSKPSAKSQLPASIANASLEELQKLFVDSLKKLKARDKKIVDLTATQESLQSQLADAQRSVAATSESARQDLEQSLQSALEDAQAANHRAKDAEQQFESLYKSHAAQQQSLDDAAAEKAMHAEQMTSLKEVLRSLAQDKEKVEKDLQEQQHNLANLEAKHRDTEGQVTQLQDHASQMQQELSQAQAQLKQAMVEHEHKTQALQAEVAAGQQELQTTQAAHTHADQQVRELQAELDSARAALADAVEQHTRLQPQLSTDAHQQGNLHELQQQHDEAMGAARETLDQAQRDLAAASKEKESLQEQLAEAAASQQQHHSQVEQLSDRVASLTQELSSRESTPDRMPQGDLQPQLDSVRADATKLANKLAQAEMRASLLRQQLQIAQHSLKQYEADSDAPQSAQLRESLERVQSLQGRLNSVEEQASSSSSENGLATSAEPVRLVIKVGTDESMPEPPSVFYAEQKNVKQKLSSLKAEKQQLQKQLSSLQESRDEYSTELLACPANLAQVKAENAVLQQRQRELTEALSQSQQAEDGLKAQLQDSQARHGKATASLRQVQQACEQLTAKTAALQGQLQATVARSDDISEQLEEERRAAESSQQHSELQLQLQSSQEQVTTLKQQLQDLLQTSEQDPKPSTEQEYVRSVETDRDALQLQVANLREALAKAQRLSTSPLPSGLTTPTTRAPSPAKDEAALHGLRTVKGVLQTQLAAMQQAAEGDQQALQELEGAQTHVGELEGQIVAWQVAVRSIEAERDRLEEQLAASQEAATKMAGLESQLQQASAREEQLRDSRAQCEYQLSQGGEEAQALLKQVNSLRKDNKERDAQLQQRQQELESLQGVLQRVQTQVADLFVTSGGASAVSAALEPANGGFGSIIMEDNLDPAMDDMAADGNAAFQELTQQLDWVAQHAIHPRADKHADDSNGNLAVASDAAGANSSVKLGKSEQHGADDNRDVTPDLDPSQASRRLGERSTDALLAEVNTLHTQAAELQAKLTAAEKAAAQHAALQQQCEELQADLAASEQAAQQANKLRQQLQEQKVTLEANQEAANRQAELAAQVSSLETELSPLQQASDTAASEDQSAQSLQAELTIAQQQAGLLQHKLDAAQAELKTLRQSGAESAQALMRQISELQAAAAAGSDQRQPMAESAQEQPTAAGLGSHKPDEPEPQGGDAARLEQELSEAHEQIGRLQQQLAGQRLAPNSRQASEAEQALDPSGSIILLAQSDLVEAADAAIQESGSETPTELDSGTTSAGEIAKQQARHVNELADVKKKFMAVARRKQQDYNKKISELEDAKKVAEQLSKQLLSQLDDASSSAQSQAADLASAQAQIASLDVQLQNALARLAQLETEQASSEEAQQAQGVLASEAEQRWAAKVEEARAEAKAHQESLAAARKEAEGERERFKKITQELKKKIDRSSKESQKAELAAAEARGKAEAEKSAVQSALDSALAKAEAEQSSLQAAIQRLEHDARDYKARAHGLLRQKEAELGQARQAVAAQFQADLAAAEAATAHSQQRLHQIQAELELVGQQRQQEMDGVLDSHRCSIAELQAELQKQDGVSRAAHISAQQFQARCSSLEQRVQDLQAHQAATLGPSQEQANRLQADCSRLERQLHAMQTESDAFRATAAAVAEAKDGELEKVLASNARLRQDLASTQQARMAAQGDSVLASRPSQDSSIQHLERSVSQSGAYAGDARDEEVPWHMQPRLSSLSRQASHASMMSASQLDRSSEPGLLEQIMPYQAGLQEATLLRLAERQAGREEELAQARQRAAQAEEEAESLTQDLEQNQQQVSALKEVIQELERQASRAKLVSSHSGVDLEYLKNTMLQLYQTGESAALLPVLATMLKFSPAELKRCQSGLSAAADRAETQQTAAARTAAASDASAADAAGYLTGWTSWAFGGEPNT